MQALIVMIFLNWALSKICSVKMDVEIVLDRIHQFWVFTGAHQSSLVGQEILTEIIEVQKEEYNRA